MCCWMYKIIDDAVSHSTNVALLLCCRRRICRVDAVRCCVDVALLQHNEASSGASVDVQVRVGTVSAVGDAHVWSDVGVSHYALRLWIDEYPMKLCEILGFELRRAVGFLVNGSTGRLVRFIPAPCSIRWLE